MLAKIADKSFLLVQANWPVEKAVELLPLFDTTSQPHIIVEETGAKELYYLLSGAEAIPLLMDAQPTTAVGDALLLAKRTATPTGSAYDDELEAPPAVVIIEHGTVIGFKDSNQAPALFESAVPFQILACEGSTRGPASSSTVTRSVNLVLADEIAIGQVVPLEVYLSSPIAEEPGKQFMLNVDLDILVSAISGFFVAGSRHASIPVTIEDAKVYATFQLQATQVGLGIIRVCLLQQGQSLGSVTIERTIVDNISEKMDEACRPVQSVALPLVEVAGLTPDLSLTIIEENDGKNDFLYFTLSTHTDLPGTKDKQAFEPILLEKKPEEYFKEFFLGINKQPIKGIIDDLRFQGGLLFQTLIPEKLRKILWTERKRIHSVQILSDDPWIPWELFTLQGWENGSMCAEQFMCETFAMTRWLPTLKAKTQLKLSNMAIVVVESANLKGTGDELKALKDKAGVTRQIKEVLPATRKDVLAEFISGQYDGWHFICHGWIDSDKPNKAVLQLENGDTLEPYLLSFAPVQNLGKSQPLVFLNACQSGIETVSLVGPAGWATQFLKAASDEEHLDNGAAAFIGAYWSIKSSSAAEFAKHFYNEFLDNHCTIGEAVLKARLAIKKDDDPTWLAYTVFAHPNARVLLNQ